MFLFPLYTLVCISFQLTVELLTKVMYCDINSVHQYNCFYYTR